MVAIKGENIVKHIERGAMGPAPDTDLLCETYIHGTVTENVIKATKRVNIIKSFADNALPLAKSCDSKNVLLAVVAIVITLPI